jgi:acetyltransferase-like isoleucine patch superfamily enzyme
VLRLIRKLTRRFQSPAPGARVGPGTLFRPGFNLDVRAGTAENRVMIGSNSVLQCTIVLEREVGTVRIGDDTFIGSSHIICSQEINIGSNVLIAWGCALVDHNSHSVAWSERQDDVGRWREGLANRADNPAALKHWEVVPKGAIVIGDKAWIGFNAIILKGVSIGEGAVVGAGSVVTKDVPEWTIVAGNPARTIREIGESER